MKRILTMAGAIVLALTVSNAAQSQDREGFETRAGDGYQGRVDGNGANGTFDRFGANNSADDLNLNTGGIVGEQFYGTAFVNGQYGMFGDPSSEDYFSGGRGFGGGVTIGKGFDSPFGSGVSIRTEVEGSVGRGNIDSFGDQDYRLETYFGNLWWDFWCAVCEGRFVPYFGGGLGYGRVRSEDSGLRDGGFAYKVGAGFNYKINEDIFVGAGYNFVGTNVETPSIEDFDGHRLEGRVGLPF